MLTDEVRYVDRIHNILAQQPFVGLFGNECKTLGLIQ